MIYSHAHSLSATQNVIERNVAVQCFLGKNPHYQISILTVLSIASISDITTSTSVIRQMAEYLVILMGK